MALELAPWVITSAPLMTVTSPALPPVPPDLVSENTRLKLEPPPPPRPPTLWAVTPWESRSKVSTSSPEAVVTFADSPAPAVVPPPPLE